MDDVKRVKMPLISHLMELRKNLIISVITFGLGFILAMPFYNEIVDFLYQPLQEVSWDDSSEILYITSLAEGFTMRLKLSALAGLIISSPVHLINLLSFILPGLLKRERRILLITLVCSFILIIGSFLYSYSTIIPISIRFLTGSGFIPDDTGVLLNFSGNIMYILQFILISLLVFQLPVILELLLMLNIVKRVLLLKMGRYVVVLFFLISALLTPPDFISQVGLALPMTLLYYLTLLVAWVCKFGEE